MLRYVSAEGMTSAQFAMLVESCQRPAFPGDRYSPLEIAERLLSKRWRAFAYREGMIAVSVQGSRMRVEAVNVPNLGASLRGFRDWMDRLAAHYKCDTVETMVFDERLARATQHIRAKPEAWVMVWQVEGTGHGRHEED